MAKRVSKAEQTLKDVEKMASAEVTAIASEPAIPTKRMEPTIRVTHYTGSTLISVNKAYKEGDISRELRDAVKAVIAKYK